jgi:hypothetical protein
MTALRVVLVGDHEVALAGTGHALTRIDGVEVVEHAMAGHAPAPRHPGDVDVVVLERSLGGSFPEDRLSELAAACPGARILSVVLRAANEYAWVRVRPTGPLFAVEATGEGPLDGVLLETAGATERSLLPAARRSRVNRRDRPARPAGTRYARCDGRRHAVSPTMPRSTA